jgi:hypothetical protein
VACFFRKGGRTAKAPLSRPQEKRRFCFSLTAAEFWLTIFFFVLYFFF